MVTETPQAVIGAAVGRRERKLASLEAVERRRLSRRAKRLLRRLPKSEEETAVKARMAAVVARMVRRYVPHDRLGEALLHEYDYWSLRRLGYDVYSDELRWTGRWLDVARTEREYCAPEQSQTWTWWRSLHWETRLVVSGAAGYILRGLAPQQSYVLHNPAFEVVQRSAGEDFLTSDGDAA